MFELSLGPRRLCHEKAMVHGLYVNDSVCADGQSSAVIFKYSLFIVLYFIGVCLQLRSDSCFVKETLDLKSSDIQATFSGESEAVERLSDN